MTPKVHAISGFILASLLYFIFPEVNLLFALLIFVSSFAIDGDYFLYHMYKTGKFSLIGTYKYARSRGTKYKSLSKKNKKEYFRAYRIFHGIEIPIILFFLGRFVWAGFYFILIGVGLHLILDWYCDLVYGIRQDKLSIILSLFRLRKLKEIQ